MATTNAGQEGTFWFVGIVEDLDDPLQLGRARVRRVSDHDGLDTDELPWAFIMLPSTSASIMGIGQSPTGLEVGTHVFGVYLDTMEKQRPIILGSFVNIPEMDLERHGVSKLARGENPIQKKQVGPEPSPAYAAKYPENKVYQSKSGHVIEIDDTEDAERIHVYHRSGTYTEINNEGRRVDKIVNDHIEVVVKDKEVFIKGDCKVTVEGNLDIAAKNIKISGGDIEIESQSLTHNGVNIGSDHKHSGVETGSGNTGNPV